MINSSGIGTYLRNILKRIRGVNLTLLGDKKELTEALPGVKFDVIEMKVPIYSPIEQLELPLKIPECDVFWSPHYNVPLLPVRAAKRLVTIHDICHLVYPASVLQKMYARLLLKAAVKFSDVVLTVSEFSKKEIVEKLNAPPDKVKVIYNGVDVSLFRPLPSQEIARVMHKYNLPDRFILFVGNLKPHKNVKKLIMAFESFIQPAYNDLYLLIIGRKSGLRTVDKETLKLISTNKKIIFLENIKFEDLPAIYNAAQVFVFPSLYEGFGLPPLEAMACGTPVVVSDIPPLKEVCAEAAVYVDPNSVYSIAENVKKVLQDSLLSSRLSETGLNRLKLFKWDFAADKFLDIIL